MISARQFVVAMGITILFPLLIHYGVSLIEPHPDFQRRSYVWVRATPTTPEGWKAWDEENRVVEQREKEARDAIDKATRPFFRLLILVAAPLGIAAIAIGLFLRSTSVGAGLIFGGMFAAADGYCGYWIHLDIWARSVSLLAGFCIVAFVGYRYFNAGRNTPI
jgi:hypothetical protein